MTFVKLVPEVEFGSESDLEMEPRPCFEALAVVEFEVVVEQYLGVLQVPGVEV